jgi:hypothetical protein
MRFYHTALALVKRNRQKKIKPAQALAAVNGLDSLWQRLSG